MRGQVVSALGLVVLAGIAWGWGRMRGKAALPWRLILIGLAAELVLAALMLHLSPLRAALGALGAGVDALARATEQGTALVFGYLGGAPLPFAETTPGGSFILAFRALPLILVVGALSALLYHLGVLPALVRGMAALLSRGFGLGGAAGFATAANVFVGMVEAPLLVRPWLAALSRADLFVVMVAGLATISGNTLAVYALFLRDVVPDAAGQLLAASLVSAPAAVLVARLMLPPEPGAATAAAEAPPKLYAGAMEAIVRGTADGLAIMLGVIAALIVFVALVALANMAIEPVFGMTLQQMAAWVMLPVAWLMGIPAADVGEAARLLGLKVIINEFVAYLDFARTGAALSDRTRIILAWALCGFANPGSMGILVGGLIPLAPERRADIAALGPAAVVGGTLACCMTGATVGVLLPS
jgi:CNT family concentrative nucleoside transporter